MKMTVTNKKIKIGDIKIGGVGSSSVVLVGDTEIITSTSYFDTPADSLLFDHQFHLSHRDWRDPTETSDPATSFRVNTSEYN